jgi:phosphosulfolactate synthase
MSRHFFDGLDGAERATKPRTTGLTMVADWGLGLYAQEDLLVTGAAYCDFGKIAVGISRLLPNDVLQRKLTLYREYQVEPFPGGQYLEYAEIEGKAEEYLAASVRAGYRWIEVSDNVAPVGVAWKERVIRRARGEHGLRVLGEVGKKEGLARATPLVDDARACLDAGAEVILLEAAELVGEEPETAREVEAVLHAIGLERVMFELPGPWIAGVTTADIHRMRRDLIDRYGRDVNLGNVGPTDLLSLEAYRRGLGVNAGKPIER